MMIENQRLADRKLELENGLLEIELKEKSNPLKKKWWDKLNDWTKKWSMIILAFVSVGGGIIGLILPIRSYIDEQEKKLEYTLTSDMVRLVNDLSSDTVEKREAAIMMLQYYEMNAFDILIFKLERAGKEIDIIASAINNIYKKGHHEILELLFNRAEVVLDGILNSEKSVTPKFKSVLNYVYVLNNLETSTKKEQKKISDFGLKILQDVSKDSTKSIKNSSKLLFIRLNKLVYKKTTADSLVYALERAGENQKLVEVLSGVINHSSQNGDIKPLRKLLVKNEVNMEKLVSENNTSVAKHKALSNFVFALGKLDPIPSDSISLLDFSLKFKHKIPKTKVFKPLIISIDELILILKLDHVGNDKELLETLFGEINIVYQKGHNSLLETLFQRTNYALKKIRKDNNLSEAKFWPILNYLSVLNRLESTPKDRNRIINFASDKNQVVLDEGVFSILKTKLDSIK